jgi:glycosyltransferase involved in cell wall biosynthesis
MRILLIGDSPYLHTGIARIVRNIAHGLKSEGHEVILGCWGWDLKMYPKDENSRWKYIDKETNEEFDAFPVMKKSEEQLKIVYSLLDELKCDILFTLGDYWDFLGFDMLKPKLDYSFKWLAYLTIESTPISEAYSELISQIDVLMSPSEFGKGVIEDFVDKECHYVPFGIDHDSFYKLDDKTIKKERKKRDLKDKVRFINVCKNIHRKNIPAFMQALKLAHERCDRIVGYLHTDTAQYNTNQVHIANMIKRLGIEDILEVPSKDLTMNIGYDDCDLNIEYNCSDAVVLTSVAEGFGLPLVEGQACGLYPMATDCSAMSELLDFGVRVSNQSFYAPLEHEVGIINYYSLASAMVNFAKSVEHCEEENVNFAKGFSTKIMNTRLNHIGQRNGN